ncbi:MAG: S-layer homology domain-containing protein [Synergistaceae bacterium]|nr:S-layer homology domain-containing protein [Synergistaceae bacterium]
MKKLSVLIAVLALAAVAAPAFSATNPFMDVPMNHWAYDAIGQLAAHGILSGYPDGLYKGKQQTTRYEMASALARALAVVDMTKASKQDVEMLKRLVVEFKDELEALGVRVDELDERVAVLEDRLGGWHIHGVLALDMTYQKDQEATNASWSDEGDGKVTFDDSKLLIERTWGENNEYFFRARLNGGDYGSAANFDRFYAEMPFFFDGRFTVGRFAWNWENAYRIDTHLGNVATGTWTNDTIISDWAVTGFGYTKNFGLGTFQAFVAHPENAYNSRTFANGSANPSTWMAALNFNMQFTEQVGFDLGGFYQKGDNAETVNRNLVDRTNDIAFDHLWTLYAGLRFNFNENIAFKGVFYAQDWETLSVNATGTGWDKNSSDPKHWAVMFDVKQPALKFTSLWAEYGQFDAGFMTRSDTSIFVSPTLATTFAPDDIKYWKVALGQEWNEKWATHLFYYGYKFDTADIKPSEFGLGVQYHLNDYTTMGLNYMHVKTDNYRGMDNDNVVRFRTKVTF